MQQLKLQQKWEKKLVIHNQECKIKIKKKKFE